MELQAEGQKRRRQPVFHMPEIILEQRFHVAASARSAPSARRNCYLRHLWKSLQESQLSHNSPFRCPFRQEEVEKFQQGPARRTEQCVAF